MLSQRGREGDLYPNGFLFSSSCMWEKLLRLMRLRSEFFPRRYVPGRHISLSLERPPRFCLRRRRRRGQLSFFFEVNLVPIKMLSISHKMQREKPANHKSSLRTVFLCSQNLSLSLSPSPTALLEFLFLCCCPLLTKISINHPRFSHKRFPSFKEIKKPTFFFKYRPG